MSEKTIIQETEEQSIDQNQADHIDNNDDKQTEDQLVEHEIVLENESTENQKQDKATNAKFAAMRIERKRQRELEQQMEAVKRGELPEHLRVNPELPAQPSISDFLSDDALSKYDYDQNKALAAFNAANTEWLIKAQDARSNAVAQQGIKTQQFTQQSAQYAEAARAHYDAAEKLNLPDYQQKEDALRSMLPAGWDTQIMTLFPEKSAALFYYLGNNPGKAQEILSMNGQHALIELTRIADKLTIKPKGSQVSKAPPVDESLGGSATADQHAHIKKQMDRAAEKGDTETYLRLKAKLRGFK